MSQISSPPSSARSLSGTKIFFITVLGVVVGLFAFIFLLIILFSTLASLGGDGTPGEPIVLEIDLRGPVLDHDPPASLFGAKPLSTVNIVRSLQRAADDTQVKGVFIRGESFGMAPASSEEIRQALIDFRESGKFVITHAQGIDSTSIIPYQAISASDEIWLQASTSLATAGLYSQSEFFGGVMEKIEAQPQFIRHGDYKTSVNSYTETGFTETHREATESLLTSLYDQVIDNIADDRGISRAALLTAFDAAPNTAQQAETAGLIDRLGYLEEARDYIREKAGDEDTIFKSITDYAPKTHYGEPTIALVTAQGTILPGTSQGSPFGVDTNIAGETLAESLDKALEDEDVQAVVLRISSPGGSASASDQVMAAVKRVQEAGKPVIISMGQYAASGGYYIAAPADHIVAMPQTITGSIGVYGGKIAFEDTFAKVGYNLDSIRIGGSYAGAYNVDEPFTPEQLASYQRYMDHIYDEFVDLVAEGRNLSREEVIAVAEGRVWTGSQALERGLVDELGGLNTAITAAKRLAEIDADSEVHLKLFPRAKTQEELISELFGGSAEAGANMAQLQKLMSLPEVQTLLQARERASAKGQELQAELPRF